MVAHSFTRAWRWEVIGWSYWTGCFYEQSSVEWIALTDPHIWQLTSLHSATVARTFLMSQTLTFSAKWAPQWRVRATACHHQPRLIELKGGEQEIIAAKNPRHYSIESRFHRRMTYRIYAIIVQLPNDGFVPYDNSLNGTMFELVVEMFWNRATLCASVITRVLM